MARKMSDCRKMKSETGCTLVIIGIESELLDEAVEHAVRVHGHSKGPELADQLRKTFEAAPSGL